MLTVAGLVVLGLVLYVAGAVSVLFYMFSRMVGSDGWDDSNITNAMRVISHAVLHPEDFGKMFYLTQEQFEMLREAGQFPERPFWYVDKDEFAEVVKTRPDDV